MNNKYKIFIPLFILLLIICGITCLYLNKDKFFSNNSSNENVNINEKDDTILEEDDNKDIIVEEIITEEKVEIQEDTKEEIKKEEVKDESKKDSSNNSSSKKPSTTKPSTSIDSNKNNITNDNDSDTKEDNVVEDMEEAAPTQAQLNNEYRNKIQNTYGVKIAYGEEMGSYLVASYLPTKMNDDATINEYLGRIETELKKYPNGFFKEMKNYGMPLTIYLVKDIPNSSLSGLTDSQIYSNIIITVKESLLFETTLNHEMMHYIDAYLNSKLYPNNISDSWNLLNPSGYSYGSFNTAYDYFPNLNNNAYFFNNYSQTNYKEDRATIFGDLMTRVVKRNCYNEGYPLYNKIKLLAEQLDEGFVSVTSSNTEYWERFL